MWMAVSLCYGVVPFYLSKQIQHAIHVSDAVIAKVRMVFTTCVVRGPGPKATTTYDKKCNTTHGNMCLKRWKPPEGHTGIYLWWKGQQKHDAPVAANATRATATNVVM